MKRIATLVAIVLALVGYGAIAAVAAAEEGPSDRVSIDDRSS